MSTPRRLLLGAALAAPFVARAQPAWTPAGPVRVIIPFPPGGTMDPPTRLAQQHVSAALGVPVVIDYRPGGATVVGTQEMARAAPDGQTLLMIANSFAANVTLRPNLPYNPTRDFAPIVMATVVPHVLVVRPNLAQDLAGLLAAGRRPGASLTYGSYGIGTSNHLGAEQFRIAAGIETQHVPYLGGQAHTDMLAGRLDFMFANLPDMIQPVQQGQVRAVGISAEARARELPGVPTTQELGFPLLLSDSWFGVICRADVPEPARARLEAAWLAALARPEVKGRLEEQGFTVLARPAAAFGAEIRRYTEVYAQVIRAGNIRVE